jgi:hypothetical protein
MNRRALKPMLAAAVVMLAAVFALFVLTPSNADEVPGTGTTSTSATASATASPSASGKNCGDCHNPKD